jgi:hypothetical protein
MEAYEKESANGKGMFGCFNVDKAAKKASGTERGYASGGVRISGCASWAVKVFLGLGFVGAVVGGL